MMNDYGESFQWHRGRCLASLSQQSDQPTSPLGNKSGSVWGLVYNMKTTRESAHLCVHTGSGFEQRLRRLYIRPCLLHLRVILLGLFCLSCLCPASLEVARGLALIVSCPPAFIQPHARLPCSRSRLLLPTCTSCLYRCQPACVIKDGLLWCSPVRS